MGLEPAELARWTRFAGKGGIGKCTATCDCVAESSDDLMFLKDDEITVLLQLQDKEGCYLGYCEGVVGRFSGSDVIFHSKLKKPIMTKRASTNTISNIPYSPSPATPTTPTSIETSATRLSSRKTADELLPFSGGGLSPSHSSLHVSPSNSTASSPIAGASSTGTRNTSQDTRKPGAPQYGTTSARDFHLGITMTDSPKEDSPVQLQPQQVVKELSTSPHSSTFSNNVMLTSPSTLPLEPQPSTEKDDMSGSLRPPSPLVNDHDPTTPTAPLRITKRSPSNPTSPARSGFSPSSDSPNTSLTDFLSQNESFDSPQMISHIFDDVVEPITRSPPPPLELQTSREVDRKDEISALPSSLDTSMITESAFDDLTTSHPGRFSRFSMGEAFTIPQLLSMTSHNTSQSISVNTESQDNHTSKNSTQSSKLDGRTSLSIAARGKVDEATLASTQAQVGIGLSLLQDLLGGMSSDSDSDSDSDYDDSDEEAPVEEARLVSGQTGRLVENGNLIEPVRTVNSTRSSVTPSEASTVHGLTYADEEEEAQTATTKTDVNKATNTSASRSMNSPTSPTFLSRSPPTTPPVRNRSLRHTQHQQIPDSFTLPDALCRDRDRRPSLATSVVSGMSGLSRKSGTSGSSWDGDIYDNYRYSTFSVGSSMTGVRRPSVDSARPRTDSVGVAGRIRLDGMGLIQGVVEEAESAHLAAAENQSNVVNPDTSFHSQDSRLSSLSKKISSLPPIDAISAINNRPSTLSIAVIKENSPLLHTDWASPSSPPSSTVQTAPPLPPASIYTPHLRQNDGLNIPETGSPVLSQVEDNEAGDGMASTMRKRLETERRPPMPNEAQHSTEMEETADPNDISITSSGLGQAIVVDDDDELPSRILASEDGTEFFDDTFVESRSAMRSPLDRQEAETSIKQGETQPAESPSPRTSYGRLAPLVVSNRTPSPATLGKEDEGDTQTISNFTQSVASKSSPLSTPIPLSNQSLPPDQPLSSEPNSSSLRPRTKINYNTEQERRSLFLPHPNAPKAPVNAPINLEPGAGVGAIPHAYPSHGGSSGNVPPVPSFHPRLPVQVVIRMALSMPPRTALLGPGKPPVQILPTIYGRTDVDLASSDRPVPIIFSIEPLNVGGKATAPHRAVLPPIGAGGSNPNGTIAAGPTSYHGSPPKRPSTTQALSGGGSSVSASTGIIPRTTSSGVPPPSSLAPEPKDKSTMDNTAPQKMETSLDAANLKTPLNGPSPIPRPNFTPKATGLRPRSRSFSGFNSSDTPPATKGEKRESINKWPKRTASSSALAPLGLKRLVKPSRPSPLSVSAVNPAQPPSSPVVLGSVPTSPLARHTFVPSRASPPSTITASPSATRFSDRTALNAKASRSTLGDAPHPGATGLSAMSLRSMNNATNQTGASSKPSFESGVAMQPSLHSKLSLPNLRRNWTREDDAVGVFDRDAIDRPKEMMQVKDMEFELVRPNISFQQRTSEDQIIGRPDNASESRVDAGVFLRSESPAVSLNSSDYRSPIVQVRNSVNGSRFNMDAGMGSVGPSNESIEAHRQRETKWISLMSSSPASLSRKSKKVKKLLVDGVPSSVRYLIWSYLADGKGRAVKGVYEQLCQRGEVGRTRDIAFDAERLFGGDAGNGGMQYLQVTKGAVIVLLQAYFSMAPDVHYTPGLAKIVGQLLLLAPEEDAFWIFTSIMDTHIRPYFTITAPGPSSAPSPIPRSTQMEVDAALYSRALEAIDPRLAKKIFVELGILPGALCHPWFTSLFVGTLPPECVNRVWDIFLYEGIPFLLRVALSLTIICRKFIVASTAASESTILATLARPPPQWLPPTAEAFLALAFSVKLKDDDIRKQRIKMGEQVKRQTQAQHTALNSVTPGGISLPSLPRL